MKVTIRVVADSAAPHRRMTPANARDSVGAEPASSGLRHTPSAEFRAHDSLRS
jgi:hypothetical protein